MLDVLAIADDLTGAMDTAAPFALRGVRVVVCEPADTYPGADVLVIDTGTRHVPPEAAAAVVGRVLAAAPPARLRFAKIDSTLRGNVVPTIRAATAGMDGVVIAPAVPGEGRVVHGGRLVVHGVPLSQTEFAHDARSPAFSGDLVTALGGRVSMPDAASIAELVNIVRAAGPRTLLAGAAGLAEALAEVRYGPAKEVTPPRTQRVVFVVGSRSALARRQVDALRAGGPDAQVLAAPPDEHDPDAVATHLAALAAARPEEDALVLVGGDTARAVLSALACERVDVHGTLAGLPWGTAQTPTGARTILTKAGGFGTDDTLVAVRDALRSR